MRLKHFLAVLALVLVSTAAFAQLTTGNLTGTVTTDGAGLPGATVTITSPNLQGSRTAVSDGSGNYNFGGLPPGDYVVRVELQGMQTVVKKVKIGVTQTSRADAELKVTAVAESITVTAAAPAVLETQEVQSNITSKLVENLPMGRTLVNTVTLAPGVTANGVGGGLVISGGQTYDSTFYVDGAVINEVLRGQPQNLFIEDAIQETTVQQGTISAEFGRFTGGIVTAVSKSGGNDFSGSIRDSLTNPTWTAQGEMKEPRPESKIQPTYEATLGGRIVKDRLWFFLAGRDFKQDQPRFFAKVDPTDTERPYTFSDKERRLEAKFTGQVTDKHSLAVSYLNIDRKQGNYAFGAPLESTVLLQQPRSLPNTFETLTYNGVLTNNFLLEGNYAIQNFAFKNAGGAKGSPETATNVVLPDYGRAGYPTFCGSCGDETRDNTNGKLKGSYFLSSKGFGTHSLTAGIEDYHDKLKANNHQSGSDYTVYVYQPPSRDAQGNLLLSASAGDALIIWWPILVPSQGNDFETQSAFVNDKWDFGTHWSFNVGGRYDKNTGKNEAGSKVSNDQGFSPRLGTTYDVFGNGKVKLMASYSRYASKIANGNVGDVSSPAGQPSYLYWFYYGPDITNQTTPNLLKQMFSWFNSVGGNNNLDPEKGFAGGGTAGIQTQLKGTLKSPGMNEISFGAGTQLGANGYLRADYQYRKWNNFYTQEVTQNSGKVADPLAGGMLLDVNLVSNTNDFVRNYRAILLQGSYHPFTRLQIGGNYTYAKLRGNVQGESSGSGPIVSNGPNYYPELMGYAQRLPVGYLPEDQRHKLRAYVSYDQPTRVGAFNFSLMQRFDSGTPYGINGTIFVVGGSRCATCVKNTFGYKSVSAATTAGYWFGPRDQFRTDDVKNTDFAITYNLPVSRAQFFVEGKIFNLFNAQAVTTVNTSVYTATTVACVQSVGANAGKRCAAFNPFSETPVEGVNYQLGPNFGKPVNPTTGAVAGDFQSPRTYRVSLGVRF